MKATWAYFHAHTFGFAESVLTYSLTNKLDDFRGQRQLVSPVVQNLHRRMQREAWEGSSLDCW